MSDQINKLNTLINKKLNDKELEEYLINNFSIPTIYNENNKKLNNKNNNEVNTDDINYDEIIKLINQYNALLIEFQNIIKQINNKLKMINNKYIFISLVKQINNKLKNNNQFILFDMENESLGIEIANHENLNDSKEYHQLFKLNKKLRNKLYLLQENDNINCINKILIKKIEYFTIYFKNININDLNYEFYNYKYSNDYNICNITLINKKFERYIKININTKKHYYNIKFIVSNINDFKNISLYLSSQNIKNKCECNKIYQNYVGIIPEYLFNKMQLVIYRNEEK